MPLRQFLRPRWLAFHLLCLGAVVAMANLPLETNVLFMTIKATKMPFEGRG